MAWVSLFVFLGSFARAAREIVIAYRYGASAEVDAYLFVFNLVTYPVGVWFSVLAVVLVPLAAHIREDSSADIERFRAEIFGLTILVGLSVSILAWLGLPPLLHSQWAGLSDATARIAADTVPVLSALALLGMLISLFSAWMLAAGRHSNTLFESVPAAVVVIALLVFTRDGLAPLVWATLAGFILHLCILATPLARSREINPPRFTHHAPEWGAFWQGFGIMFAGQLLMSFTYIIDQFFAARLEAGSISTLGYANRILALILGMGAMAVSRATLPVFSSAHAQSGNQLQGVAAHWARVLFLLGVISTILGWWLAPLGVRLLFERGAFTAQDTLLVAEVLRYGLVQLPFYFSGLVFVSYLASRRLYGLIFWSGLIGLCTKLIGNTLFFRTYGIEGIALATACMYAANFTYFWLVFHKVSRNI